MDAQWAERIISKYCLQTDGKTRGQPITIMPWQKDFLKRVEHAKDIWLELPRKKWQKRYHCHDSYSAHA
jgi:hypothetical protein